MTFAVFPYDCLGFSIGQIFYALLGVEVEFDPEAFIFCIDHAEGVAAEHMHVAVAYWYATVAHGDGYLVQGFRQRSPEVPVILGAA
ncbi:MAG: hypothetical protein ILNGONEN_00416 [Syntrophorhabdaceae bacterium]|nr:hypothetical protein [Syntrophorhabdaceae bacterium]